MDQQIHWVDKAGSGYHCLLSKDWINRVSSSSAVCKSPVRLHFVKSCGLNNQIHLILKKKKIFNDAAITNIKLKKHIRSFFKLLFGSYCSVAQKSTGLIFWHSLNIFTKAHLFFVCKETKLLISKESYWLVLSHLKHHWLFHFHITIMIGPLGYPFDITSLTPRFKAVHLKGVKRWKWPLILKLLFKELLGNHQENYQVRGHIDQGLFEIPFVPPKNNLFVISLHLLPLQDEFF